MISAGGAVGGLFVGLLAPHLFNGYYEFPIGLGLCAALIVVVLFGRLTVQTRPWMRIALRAALFAYLFFLGTIVRDYVKGYRMAARNFYGRLAVYDDVQADDDSYDAARHLLHGVIDHGIQPLDTGSRRLPVSYFCPGSGVGIAMKSLPTGLPHKIGILGLGCGTLAAYGMPSDIIRIYEINPLVVQIAQSQFSYLKDTAARTEVVLGDGRLSLEREPNQQFDLLVMDAFSGDSVPVHLVTREAFRTYFRHLKPGGILAVNITNRYLDMNPVMERAASDFGKLAVLFDYEPMDDLLCYESAWMLVMDRSTYQGMRQKRAGRVMQQNPQFREWTDDFSNMQRILK
jgi:SAM-dependent methyltransferase